MNKLDKDYLALCQDILTNGVVKSDRTGTGTISVFGREIKHKMSDGFPLLTTKKMSLKNIATELRWFLNGDTNIKFLIENNCHIWDGDAYKRYLNTPVGELEDSEKFHLGAEIHRILYGAIDGMGLPQVNDYIHFTMEQFLDKILTDDKFSEIWGELGPIYGKQWVNWRKFEYDEYDVQYKSSFKATASSINQIADLIHNLKNNPDSRRLMVNAWNVAELDDAVLPPCHYGFQCWTRELTVDEREEAMAKMGYGYPATAGRDEAFDHYNVPKRALNLMWNQRSVDTALGLPYNIASYGMLLTMLANDANMVPDELIGRLGDTHLYSNHLNGINEQLGREYTFEERCELFHEPYDENETYDYLKSNLGWGDRLTDEIINFPDDCTSYHTIRMNHENIPKRSREPYDLPTLVMKGGVDTPLDGTDFELVNYKCHAAIRFPLSN